MKKFGLILIILLFFWQGSMAHAALAGDRVQCRQVIQRSEAIILTARKSIELDQQYVNFGLAYSHQVYAKKLFRQGIYKQAIFHSLRARLLAVQVIMSNKTNSPLYDAMYDRLETRYNKIAPPPAKLDRTLRRAGKVWDNPTAVKRLDRSNTI